MGTATKWQITIIITKLESLQEKVQEQLDNKAENTERDRLQNELAYIKEALQALENLENLIYE